jgi:outer membrane protein W
LVLGLILVVASAPALAAAGDMKIRFGAAYLNPTGDQTVVWFDEPPEYEASMIEAQGSGSGFVGFEIMINDFFGLDVSVLGTSLEVEEDYIWRMNGDVLGLWVETAADVWMTPVFFSANFHFVSNDQIDLYVGPSIAYVWYGDWDWDDWDDDFDLNVDEDLTLGGVFGMDVPLGSSNWMFSTAVRYLKTSAELEEASFAHELGRFTLDIDPWILQVGVGVKF